MGDRLLRITFWKRQRGMELRPGHTVTRLLWSYEVKADEAMQAVAVDAACQYFADQMRVSEWQDAADDYSIRWLESDDAE